ncbi:transposase [Thalassobaculum litoreum]|uniref:Transposase n=1 Tax=Thalassobaculum litoreum DSM 18839 TaxID=1123362 RepID=A0A8G2BL36_9PROT|nr:transposase [Thalassobaculum litoreum]SDG32708.1 Transposase [Thalassobaculum litoreum DSM 18839]
MMGERTVMHEELFYGFNLERHVPGDHLLRAIDRFVDLSEVRRHLAPYYSPIGRPSIDPELLIRMLIVGYCFGIRSERRLCEEVHLNLAYRWFCRLGLEGDVPDHSTFSKTRHGRFRESDLLRELFETVLRRCMAEGLVGGEGFAVDASLIVADAHRQRGVARTEDLPQAGRAVEEYLAVLDDAAFGGATPVPPKYLSPADPAARWTASWGGPAVFAYCTNYLIDVENAVIVDVEATTAVRQAEVGAARTMIDRTQERFGLWPERLIGDTGYGSAEMLNWLVHARGIEPHIPVFDKSKRTDGTFSREDFSYDHDSDTYRCLGGKLLQNSRRAFTEPRSGVTKDDTRIYRASKSDCDACSLKQNCCPGQPARKIPRSIHEGARDMARDIAKTETYATSRRQRKKVEMLFAHLKRILKLGRLRLRGPCGARDEFLLAATAQNLRKLAKICAPRAPAPAT